MEKVTEDNIVVFFCNHSYVGTKQTKCKQKEHLKFIRGVKAEVLIHPKSLEKRCVLSFFSFFFLKTLAQV